MLDKNDEDLKRDFEGNYHKTMEQALFRNEEIYKEFQRKQSISKDQQQKKYLQNQKWLAEPHISESAISLYNSKPDEFQFDGIVEDVVDGSTIILREIETAQSIRVRLYGLDAPELIQEHGGIVKRQVAGAILNKNVKFRIMPPCYCYRVMIWGEDNKNLNIRMVKEGWALKFMHEDDEYATAFIDSAITAQVSRLGIWSYESKPIEPWTIRRRIKDEQDEQRKKANAPVGNYITVTQKDRDQIEKEYQERYAEWNAKWYVKFCKAIKLNFLVEDTQRHKPKKPKSSNPWHN